MNQEPIISIIIPCYNAERWIQDTLNSVRFQICEEGMFECVIVNDGSTDESERIIMETIQGSSIFHYIGTGNQGVAAARNLAISKARGKYIVPLDADDQLDLAAIWTFNAYWKQYPEASLLVPARRCFGGRTKTEMRTWKGYEALKRHCSPGITSSFKKADWERVGGYRDGTMYEDWEFWLRLLYNNDRVINIPDALYFYNSHSDSRWHQAALQHRRELDLIKKMNPEIFK